MKVPTRVTLAFDPEKSGLVSFSSEVGKILWCCVKYQHLADQYFDLHISQVAEYINVNKIDTYEAFKNHISVSKLNMFGIVYKGTRMEIIACCHRELDDEFWQGVWEYITGEKELEIEVKLTGVVK